MSHKSQSIKYMRSEAKKIYHLRRAISRLSQENLLLEYRIEKAIEILKLCNSKCAKETIAILKGEEKQ